MSTETRSALAYDSRLVTNETQRADLLDPEKTNTWLIEFLVLLLDRAGHPILITALNSDHDPGTYHEAGRAVDLWNADWEAVGDEAILDVMEAAAAIGATQAPALVEVGLSGTAAQYEYLVEWPTENVFVESYGDDNEHLHLAVGIPT